VQLWADVLIPLIALAGGWFGNSWKYRRDRRDRLRELRQKSDELTAARRRDAAAIERDREHEDRDWIEKAAVLCRSSDPRERQLGRGYLVALAAMGNKNPRVVELLDQVTLLELGQTVEEIREARMNEQAVEVIEEVVVSDGGSGGDDGGGDGGAAGVGEDEAAEDRQEDQGDQEPGRRGPGPTGGRPWPGPGQ
jgi:hypothetical protein